MEDPAAVEPPRIAVAGGGIGGLTLATALATAGAPCEVFEQTRQLAEVGAGVQLAPNAVRPLLGLGLGPALREHAVRIEAMEIRGHHGRPVARTRLGAACEELFGAPYYAVHRAQLHDALHDALRASAGPEALRLGHRLLRAEEEADGARLHFEDGSAHRADVLVGADGIHSVVREELAKDDPVFSGLGVFRGLVPVAALPSAAHEPLVRMWLGPGGHFVCYPVSGGEQISFAATAPLRDRSAESWTAAGDPAELTRVFGGWKGLVADLVHAACEGAAAGPVRRWALHDREPLPAWSTNRLTVLGDAAHPMLPFMAQGANQAVEDAMDLAACLAGAGRGELPARLARYEALRAPRTAALQQGSRGNAKFLHLADGPEQRQRDVAMYRGSALRDRAWLFGHDSGSHSASTESSSGRAPGR